VIRGQLNSHGDLRPDMKILLAEDTDDSRFLFRIILEGFGHEVHEATNGREAVESAIRRKSRSRLDGSVHARSRWAPGHRRATLHIRLQQRPNHRHDRPLALELARPRLRGRLR